MWSFAFLMTPEMGEIPHPPPSSLTYWAICALGVFNLVLVARSVDMTISELFSVDGISAAAVASTTLRYDEQGSHGNPLILALSLFLLYRAGSSYLPWWKTLVAFIPILLHSVISTAKWPMFLGMSFFIAGFLVSKPFGKAWKRSIAYVLLFTLVGGTLGGVALLTRGVEGAVPQLAFALVHYLLAPFPALGWWLVEEASNACCSWGAWTFLGPLDAIGAVTRIPGVFDTFYSLYDGETNIYTAWRFLVTDFSLIGPFVLNSGLAGMFIIALLARASGVCAAVKAFAILGSLLSISVTIFVHNSTAFAVFLAMGYSFLVANPARERDLATA